MTAQSHEMPGLGAGVDVKPTEHTHQLRRGALGVGFIVFFVVSAAAPLTALAGGVPVGMLLGNGPGIPALFVAVTLVLLVFAAGYTAMARHVTNAGSFYAFASCGLSPTAGGAAATVALLAYNCMQIGLYGLFGVACAGLAGSYGLDVPWWVFVFVAMALVGLLGYRQIDLSAKVLAALVLAEYLIVLVLDLAILGRGGAAGLDTSPFTPTLALNGSPSIGLLFCFACFMGFEASTIYGEEARDPQRTIPRATYTAVLVIGVFYAFSSWSMVMGAGAGQLSDRLAALGDPTAFLFSLADEYTTPAVTTLMRVLFISSVFAALVAFHNAVSRYFYVLGREGLLHSHLGRTHHTHQSPHMGSVVQTILAVLTVTVFAVTGSDPVLTLFSWLTNLATICVIALMALASLSVLVFFSRRGLEGESTLRVRILPIIAGVLLTVVLVLAVVNFSVLTGASSGIAWAITSTLPIVAVIGVVLARQMARTDPQRYRALGANRL